MREIIVKSSRIVNTDIVLVLLAGFFGIRMFSEVMTFVSLLGLAISILIGIVVYGRIVARVRGVEIPPSSKILKDNWFNYLIVVVLLALPVLLFSQLAKLVLVSPESFILAKEGLNALIHMATIYVLPIVFIKRQNLIAIAAGVSCLFQNIKGSLAILILVAVMFTLNVAVLLGAIYVLSPESSVFMLVSAMLVANIIFAYLTFLVFAAATTLLLEPNEA